MTGWKPFTFLDKEVRVVAKMTTSMLREIRRLIEVDGHTCSFAAKEVGVSSSLAAHYMKELGVTLPHRGKRDPDSLTQYGVYDRETDALVALGNIYEVAEKLGVAPQNLRVQMCRGTNRKYYFTKITESEDSDGK